MKITFYRIMADLIFLSHIAIVLVLIFGIFFENIGTFYIFLLLVILSSEIILGYCPLTRLEFRVRKLVEPSINYDSSFFVYYGHKFYEKHISTNLIKKLATVFLVISLIFALAKYF